MRDTTSPALAELQDELTGWRTALLVVSEEHAETYPRQRSDSAAQGAGMAGCFGLR